MESKTIISYRATYARIRRRLAKKNRRLWSVKARDHNAQYYYIADLISGEIVKSNFLKLSDVALYVGVLRPWEIVENDAEGWKCRRGKAA